MQDPAVVHAQADADEALVVAQRAEGKIDTHERECAVRWRAVDDKLTLAAEQRRDQAAKIEQNAKTVADGFREIRSTLIKAAFGLISALGAVVLLMGRFLLELASRGLHP